MCLRLWLTEYFSPPTDHLSDAALVPGCRIVCLCLWHCRRLILLPPTRLPPPSLWGPPSPRCLPYLSHHPSSSSSPSISFSPSRADCASCFQSICRLHRSLALLLPLLHRLLQFLFLSSFSRSSPLPPPSSLVPSFREPRSSILYRAVSLFAL